MTALRKEDVYLTPEEYLAAELVSDVKHEYLDGVVYAMAGANRSHNLIAVNLAGELRNQLRGKKCIPFGSDMRLHIRKPGATFYYYPDITVDCSDGPESGVEEPTVIFEILSPGTMRADLGDKLFNYQSLPSLRVYVIVDQSRCAVTVHRRAETDGEWAMDFLGDIDTTLELPEIECALPLRAIYERVLEE